MKTEYNHGPVPKPEIKFPCLARAELPSVPASFYTILFISPTKGTVVQTDASKMDDRKFVQVGYQSESWIPITDDNTWTVCRKGASVTITQE